MNSFITKSTILLVFSAGLLATQDAGALPPTGLTQIRASADTSADLAVIDGIAYASSMDGIYVIDSAGVQSPTTFNVPGFGSLIDTTRVVQTAGGDVFVLADVAGSGIIGGPRPGVALFDLNNPFTPNAMWGRDYLLRGLDGNSRGFGIDRDGFTFELFPDGTASELTVGPPASNFWPLDVTPNGTAIGYAQIAGTVGTDAALLLPNGEVEFIPGGGTESDIRDRADGDGVNLSLVYAKVIYGDGPTINIDRPLGILEYTPGGVQVSETEFVVIEVKGGPGSPSDEFDEFRVYYPGVNPAGIDLSVSLFDMYPELNGLDFNRVLDIASAEGQIHMLLSGNDGLWLFAAPDPTAIPEPSGLALIGVLFLALCTKRRTG